MTDSNRHEIVDCETANNGKHGIESRCLNPVCGKAVETRPGAVRIKTSCDHHCRNTLSAFRRVARAMFPKLEPAQAIDKLLRLADQEKAERNP